MRHEMFGAYVEASWKLFKNFPFTNFYILVVSFDKWKAWVADWLKSLLLKIPLWWIDVCLEISSVFDMILHTLRGIAGKVLSTFTF